MLPRPKSCAHALHAVHGHHQQAPVAAGPQGMRGSSLNNVHFGTKAQLSSQAPVAEASTPSAGATASVVSQQGTFASLTRVLLIGQPSNLVRNLAGRKWRVAGPVSLLLFLFGLIVGVLAAVRTVLVKRVKSCKCCRGYGIVRCRLCNGEGSVEWRGGCCTGTLAGHGGYSMQQQERQPCRHFAEVEACACTGTVPARQCQDRGEGPGMHAGKRCGIFRGML